MDKYTKWGTSTSHDGIPLSALLDLLEPVIMKNILLSSLLIALVSAAAVPGKVDYDGYRVVRVKSSDKVKSIIAEKSLETWVGAGKANGQVDVVVPPGVEAFDGTDAQVMHQDLGASIARESNFEVYART